MNIHASLFAIKNPLHMIDRCLHPYRHHATISYRKHDLAIDLTQRARTELLKRRTPLKVEMQLYFSCVVKKRVLFHEATELKTLPVDNQLEIVFRLVQASSCDPLEFARNFPIKQEFTGPAAKKIHPKRLSLDFKHKHWLGEFYISDP